MVFEPYTTSKMKMKMKKEMKKCDKATEFTFVLGMPLVFLRGYVGVVLQEFTNIGLKLIGLRCMSVTAKFVNAHYQRKGRKTYTGPATDFVNRGPFLAMILQGVQAVNKAQELVSSKKEPPFWDRWPLVYSSATVSMASEDAEMWFSANSFYSLEDALKKENLMFASLLTITYLKIANQRFLLIKPKAVQDGIMPKLLSTIEKKCYYIREETHKEESGIALSDDKSSSSGNTRKEEFGIALVLSPACLLFGEDSAHIRDRDLVYLGTEGESLELIKEFFQFGVVGWKDPTTEQYCGGLFESTLTGLQFEDKEDLEKFL
ncbi:hypothetical protein MKW92_031495 [Papaver armeniacum]|nr:hypothetical protein MKW92_031495 [Papaver armeniacum]